MVPDASLYAVATAARTVQVVALREDRTQVTQTVLEGFSTSPTRLALSANGTRVVAGTRRGSLYSIHLQDGTRAEIKLEGSLEALAVSPDGAWIATAENNSVSIVRGTRHLRLWDARTGELLATSLDAHSRLVTGLTISADGSVLASCSRDKSARTWKLPSLEFLGPEMTGRDEELTSVTVSSANRRLATGSIRGRIQIWSLDSRELLYSELVSAAGVHDLAFSPDGKRLAVSSGADGLRVLESSVRQGRYARWSGQEAVRASAEGQ
jgi:WD40 repeat protein